MKRNGITFFSIFILTVFAAAIFYFFHTICADYKNGLSRSEQIFREVSALAENSPDKIKTELFSNEVGILSAKYSKNNETLIAYPDEQTASQVINSKLVKVFYKTIVIQEDTYELKIASYILRPNIIYNAARNSFITILAATIATIAVLIFISVKARKLSPAEEDIETEEPLSDDFSFEDETQETDKNAEDEKRSADFQASPENNNDSETEAVSDFQAEDLEPDEEPDATGSTDESDSDAYYNEHKVMQNAQSNTENPPDLKERINFELTKAASSDQDFSILLIEIKDSSKISGIEKFLTDNYGKENVYTYRENVFALLKENTNIDEAEDKAALIENNIRTVFEEPNVFIGISSRSIRTITADRLIAEAEEALNHANSDPDARIVGFHVDIEKYRELVEK